MDSKEMLAGLVKEKVQESNKEILAKVEEEAAARKEADAKYFEAHKEVKTRLDDLQGKLITLNQQTGSHNYVFKGYDYRNMSKNFKMDIPEDVGKKAADIMRKTLASSSTGAYATLEVEYSSALLGLAELSSVALSKFRIFQLAGPSLKVPTKATRATVDAQAFGTANAAAATALGQLTFTIDKRVGSYETLYNDVLADEQFDVIGQFVEPMIAEAIGQNIDTECFKKTEFTTDIAAGGTAAVSASGTVAIAAAITYANLVTTAFTVELERGLSPEWFMPRGAFAACVALVDSVGGLPILNPVPISGGAKYMLLGYPVNIVPTMDNTPDNGNIRVAFGDPKQYIVALRQGVIFQVNPYVQMKEGMTQFIGYARADGNIVTSAAWATIKRVDA